MTPAEFPSPFIERRAEPLNSMILVTQKGYPRTAVLFPSPGALLCLSAVISTTRPGRVDMNTDEISPKDYKI